jgi:hypothetical protein
VEPAAAVVSAPVAVAAELEPGSGRLGLCFMVTGRAVGLPTGQRKRKQKIFESSTLSPRRLALRFAGGVIVMKLNCPELTDRSWRCQ